MPKGRVVFTCYVHIKLVKSALAGNILIITSPGGFSFNFLFYALVVQRLR